jgi:glycosyltransferase involved in cell wall biosynthesis
MKPARPRILVVAPFTHQNGHFVTFPRDIACALDLVDCDVTLIHTRPFRTELDWFGRSIKRICLRDDLAHTPRWWQELWSRLADRPSNLCLAWMIWKQSRSTYDLVLWTDFQAQHNLWPLAIARWLRLYRHRTAFFEHHPPDDCSPLQAFLPPLLRPDRLRLAGVNMFVISSELLARWNNRLNSENQVGYMPWGVWVNPQSEDQRTQARRALGIGSQQRVLLVFGVQAIGRKHLDTLRRVIAGLAPAQPLLLLFVGANLEHEPHPFSDWQSQQITVRIDEGFIAEDRVVQYFSAADAIWTYYRQFPGASGALLQAMGFARMALCSDEGEIGSLCKTHNLGYLIAQDDDTSLRDVLEQFAALPPARQREWERQIAATAEAYAWPQIARTLLAKTGLHP